MKKLSQLAYKFRALPDHTLHTELCKARNMYGEAIDMRCTGMNVKVHKMRNKDQVPREKP